MTVHSIPMIGLGTYGRSDQSGVEAILQGLEIGYRHLDTAQTYDTERVIADAIEQSGLKRENVFLTTKVSIDNLHGDLFLQSVERSLDTLRIDHVDLLLIHWPSPREVVPLASYMEDLALARQRGFTKLIGVSNFPIDLLEKAETILGAGELANNQVEIHPYLQNTRLVDHCLANDIVPTAYLPLARGRVAKDPVLVAIAERLGVARIASRACLAPATRDRGDSGVKQPRAHAV